MLIIWEVARVVDIKDMSRTMLMQKIKAKASTCITAGAKNLASWLTKPVRPGFGLGRYQTGPNSKFKFEFKKNEKFTKIPKNTLRCDESNSVKFSQKIVHLV